MWLCSFTPYNALKYNPDKMTSLAMYFILLSQICHFLTWALFTVSPRYTIITIKHQLNALL